MADALSVDTRANDAWTQVALACAITWAATAPMSIAWVTGHAPGPVALALGIVVAFGPTLAAVLVARPRGEVREIFSNWKTSPLFVAAALCLPALFHGLANAVALVAGRTPEQWWYPPEKPEAIAALVLFSVGEEFGWRGFAYPRFAAKFGAPNGALLLGVLWGLWHLSMYASPEGDVLQLDRFVLATIDFALNSLVLAWVFERSGRSMLVAIAMHAGGHLDNATRIPESAELLRIARFVLLGCAAGLAAWDLSRRPPPNTAT